MRIPSPSECGLPEKFSSWRPAQEHAIDVMITPKKRAVALSAPTGFGKTVAYVAAAIISKLPTCIVTNSRGLQDQILSDFRSCGAVDIRGRRNYTCDLKPDYTCEEGYASRCPYKGTVGCPASQAEMRAATSPLVVTNYDKWIAARKFGQGMAHFQQVIFDEGHCFVAGTLVDGIPIENLMVGQSIRSIDTVTGRVILQKITKTYSRKTTKITNLQLRGGRHIRCTPDHKLYTNKGWISAADSLGCFVLSSKHGTGYIHEVRDLRESPDFRYAREAARFQEAGQSLLQPLMRCQARQAHHIGRAEGGSSAENANCEPYAEFINTREGEQEADRSNPSESRRERARSFRAPAGVILLSGSRLEDGEGGIAGKTQAWISEELQDRYLASDLQDSNRSRWQESWISEETGAGSEEIKDACWVRVDSVEIHEQGCSSEFERLCPGGFTYDIQVDNYHTYFANGIAAHNCSPEALARNMQVVLNHKEIEDNLKLDFLGNPEAQEMTNWKSWAAYARAIAEQAMLAAQARITGLSDPKSSWVRHYTHMRNLTRRLATIATASAKDWVVDEIEQGFQFDPIRPGRYAESALLLKVPRIIVISATLRPKTMFMIGLGKDSFDFHEFDSDFDPKRCPIYYVPTMRVDKNAKDLSMLWVRLDQIIAKRQDRKGIVHTISYFRRDEVVGRSRFSDRMLINPKGEATTSMVESFKASPPGTIFVSPSVGMGYDFPGTTCEYQFVCKIPFPDGRSKIIKARQADDPEYGPYEAMQKLVQIFGRAMRSKDDRSESFIGDDHLSWFLPRYGHLAPKSFHGFFRRVDTLPQPPEKLP